MADELPATTPDQAAPAVTPDPPIKRLWNTMRSSNKAFTRSFEDFSTDMQDEDNIRSLHEHLSKTREGFTVPLDKFESDMGYAKKKAQLEPSGDTAAISSLAPSGDESAVAPPPAAEVMPAASSGPQIVDSTQIGAQLAADPEQRARIISDEAQTMGLAGPGTKRTIYTGPVDEQGVPISKDGIAPYRARNSDTGVYYTDEPLSKMVDGKEQSEDDAGMLTIRNQFVEGVKGFSDFAGALNRKVQGAAGIDPAIAEATSPFHRISALLGKGISEVSPFHEASQSLHMKTARVAGLALPALLTMFVPEGKLAQVTSTVVGMNFDGQMLAGSKKRGEAAGLSGSQLDNYTLADGAATLLVFKLGGAGLNAVGQKLAKTAVMEELGATLKAAKGRISEAEMGGLYAKAMPEVLARLQAAAKGGAHLGPLMAANTIKEKIGEHIANQQLGRAAFAEKSFGQDALDVAGSLGEGAMIGGITGAVEPIRTTPSAKPDPAEPTPAEQAPVYDPAAAAGLASTTAEALGTGKQFYRLPEGDGPSIKEPATVEKLKESLDSLLGKAKDGTLTRDDFMSTYFFQNHRETGNEWPDALAANPVRFVEDLRAGLSEQLGEQPAPETPEAVVPQSVAESPIAEPVAPQQAGEPEVAQEAPEQVQPEQPPADPSAVDVTGQAPEPIPAEGEPSAANATEIPPVVAPEQQAEADAQAPEGQNARQHPLHYDETTQAGLRPEERYYTPRTRIQNADEANSFIDEHGLDNAYKFVMAGERDTADGNPIHAAVLDEVRRQTRARLLDASLAADKAGNAPEANRLLQQSLDVLGKRAIARTETAQALAQVEGDIVKNPEKAMDDFAASIPAMKEKVRKQNKGKAAAADKEATTKRKAKVETVLADDAVQAAAASVAEQAVTGQKPAKESKAPTNRTPADAPTWGSKNKLFTKESAATARAALKKLGLSSIVPPELIHFMGYHMEAGARSFAEVSKRVVRDLGAKVKPLLKDAYEAAKKELIAKGDSGQGFDGPDAVDAAMKAELANALADRIVSEAKPKVPGKYDPVQELLDTLLKKVRETLPATKQKPANPREAIAHALQNKAEYADVFEQSKALVEKKIDELNVSDAVKDKMRTELRAYHADTIGDPFAVRQVDATMRTGMKELGQKMEHLVRQHADVREAAKGSLIDKLIAEAGLTPEQAKTYADAVSKRFAEISEKKAQSLVGRILAPVKAKLPASKTRTAVDKLTEALDIADATGDGASPAAALLMKMAGIPEVTVEDIKAFRALEGKVRTASQAKEVVINGKKVSVIDTKAQQKAVADLLRYGAAKMGKVTWWAKTRAMQYAFRLSGADTQGRNLKANVLHTVFEQGLITPAYNMMKNRSIYGGTAGFKGYVKGQRQGAAEAAHTLQTGYNGENTQDKFGDNSPLESEKMDTAGSKFRGAWKVVNRAMVAGDQVTSIPTENSRTFEVAVQIGFEKARGYTDPTTSNPIKLRGLALRDAAWAEANEILYNTKEAIADIDHILEQENLPAITLAQVQSRQHTLGEAMQRGIQRDIRKADLLRQARAATNPELVSEAQDYARIQTLNGDVPGALGVALNAISQIGKASPILDAIMTNVMPFMKIPANSLLRKLEWGGGPVTLVKAFIGRTSLTVWKEGAYSRKLSPDERGKLALRGALSTAAWAGLYGLIHNGTLSITGPATGRSDEDLLQPAMTVALNGKVLFNFKDSDFEYPLVIAAALQTHIRKQNKTGKSPDMAQLLGVAAMHSGAYMVTTGPMNGPADLANVMIQANQGNYAGTLNYLKRFAITAAKTGTEPAIMVQSLQAYRDWQGMPQREKKSNSLPSEILVNFAGFLPYAEVGADKINFAGQPIVLNRDGEVVWQDKQTEQIATTLVHLGLMPPRQAPTDDRLMLYDPKSGDKVTPLTNKEFHDYVVMRGQEFVKRLLMKGEAGTTRLSRIESAKTGQKAKRLRDIALDKATEDALKVIEKQRAAAGQPATSELSRRLKIAADAANYEGLKAGTPN